MWWDKLIKTNIPLGNKERLILFFVLITTIFFIIAQLFFWPAVANMKKSAAAIPKRQEDLRQLLSLRDEFYTLEDKMDKINLAIQRRGSNFELLTFLEELAKRCNIENKIVSMRPLNFPSGIPDEMTVEIDIDGLTTEEMTKYFFEIENSGKLIYLRKTTIHSNFGREKFLNVTLQVTTLTKKL